MTPEQAKQAVLKKFPDAQFQNVGMDKVQLCQDKQPNVLSGQMYTFDEAWIDAARKWCCRTPPCWCDRPTEPGKWLCVRKGKRDVVRMLDDESIRIGWPVFVDRCYGPIPEDT